MDDLFDEALDGRGPDTSTAGLWLREIRDLVATGWRLRHAPRPEGARRVRVRSPRPGWIGLLRGVRDDTGAAVRSLWRRPLFALFAVMTVGLGVGATTAMFSTLEGVVLRPVPYENAERMVTLMRPIGNSGGMRTPSMEQIDAWSAMDDIFEHVEVASVRAMTLLGAGDPLAVQVGLIRPTFHEVFDRFPVLGRTFTPEEAEEDQRVVMLGHGLWTSRFGRDASVLGTSVELDGEAWTVVGVMPPRTPLLSFGARDVELWRPFVEGTTPSPPIGILREGVTLERALERLEMPIDVGETVEATGIGRSLVESMANRLRDTVRILMAAVVMLLLIACVNVSNLLLTRANQRRRETAVRAALGGGRFRLARQLGIEGLLLGAVGGALGLGLAWLGLEAMLSLRPASLESLDSVALNGRVLVFTALVTAATSVVASLVPAWQATRPQASEVLRTGARAEGQGILGSRFRWLLVTAEIALSFALVVGSALVVDALRGLQRRDPGFDVDRVAVLEIALPSWRFDDEPGREAVFAELAGAIAALPGVAQVARSLGMPGEAGVAFGSIEIEGRPRDEATHVLHGPPVDENYFAVLGQPLLRGRGFTAAEIAGEESVVVVGEGTARQFFDRVDVVGDRFRIDGADEWSTIVGVATDVPMDGLASTADPLQLYWPLSMRYGATGTFLVRPENGVDPARLLPSLRSTASTLVPDARIGKLDTLAARLAASLGRERFTSTLLSIFTLMALLLAAVGLYGVVSQVVGHRTREIGIRMALGADRGRVRALVIRYGVGSIVVGVACGAVLVMVGVDVLASRLFGVGGGRMGAFGIGGLAIVGVALLATWIPARRATRVDPVAAMRVE